MSSTVNADIASQVTKGHAENPNHKADLIESNHNLPARTVIDVEQSTTMATTEDAETTAASEELKHTSISDKFPPTRTWKDDTAVEVEATGGDKTMKETVKDRTPEPEPTDRQDEEMKERISSPKKKRGRDQDEEDTRDFEESPGSASGSAADGSAPNTRAARSGPEKKRHRDTSEEFKKAGIEGDTKVPAAADSANKPKPLPKSAETSKTSSDEPKKLFGSDLKDKPQTSPTAFASSGFASLAATSTSGFGSLGATKPSVFGGGKPASSGFGALASKPTNISDKPATGLSFGGSTNSGFGGLGGDSGSVFGAKLGNGFAGGSGPKLSSFAAPKKGDEPIDAKSSKPVKAFGAPEASDEDDSASDDSHAAVGSGDEESAVPAEDKKKTAKLGKVHIEDGESGEATLLQVRAKLFALESKEAGWKERGVGTLKVNVPQSCASFDDNGTPIPGSFDASGLDDDEETDPKAPKVARLIMRQENTHRVILNSILVRAMKFEDKPGTNSVQIMFTAFEGDKEPKPINMLLKLSETNGRLFRSEIDSIQHEL